ncbi:MAG: hypothetical protein Q8941_17190 [Bacteroidota bacterium]|nr:hypothetical protein [Bacteroidota bacterium]
MCFSAGASFGASTVLAAIGVAAMVKARTSPQRLFATIPFVFAVQQLAEGMLWLSLKDPGLAAWQPFLTYTFLVFAMMFWPVWIPITIRLLEKDPKRKKIMSLLLSAGILVSAGIGFVLLLYPVKVIPASHHLHYSLDLPPAIKSLTLLFTLLYIITTIAAPFISGIKRMKWLGLVFLISYAFAAIFYSGFIVSVWCYFAAILSMVVVWIMSGLRKPVL